MSWKTIKSETIDKNPFWEYKHDVFEMAGGRQGDYYYASTPGSVIIVPILGDGRVVLVNIYRYLHNRFSLEFPGGAMSADKSAAQAAARELREEAGYEADDLINIGQFSPFNGMTNEICHVFLAKKLKAVAASPDVFEELEVAARRLDEMDNLIFRNEIWDGQTLAAWSLARPHLFR